MGNDEKKQKICLVTGAGRGIGRSIALALSKQHHVICASKSEQNCRSVADEIKQLGGSAEHAAVDVSEPDDIANVCDKILEKHHSVDILVNNAGITRDCLIMRMSDDNWNDVISTNLTSCFHFIKCLLPQMVKNRWGRIVNISSVVGEVGNFGQSNYAAAKAGIIGLTKSVAREAASRKVTVNAIAPGFINSSMTEKLSDTIKSEIIGHIPMKSIGEPDDVAAAVVFLCSENARYITGHVLNVDGGMAM